MVTISNGSLQLLRVLPLCVRVCLLRLSVRARARQCVGDQFAMLEATSTLALVLRRFDFEFGPEGPGAVGLRTGATIHTEHGLWMRVRARRGVARSGSAWVEPAHPVLNPGGAALKKQLTEQLKEQECALSPDHCETQT